jgi:hypothetical protein
MNPFPFLSEEDAAKQKSARNKNLRDKQSTIFKI